VPGAAQSFGDRVPVPATNLQDTGEFGLDDTEPLVLNAGVIEDRLAVLVDPVGRVPHGMNEPFAGGETADNPARPGRVRKGNDAKRLIVRGPLPGAAGLADEDDERVGSVARRADLHIWRTPDGRAKHRKDVEQDRDGIALGVWGNRLDHIPGETIE